MNHFPFRNIHPEFDHLVNANLGHYVYILRDPKDKKPFYVGKGGGTKWTGNQRVLDHFHEARHISPQAEGRSLKVARIHTIWQRGEDVEWLVVRHGLETEAAALDVECAVMDVLLTSRFELTNATGGHGKNDRGVLTESEVYADAAPHFSPQDLPTDLIGVPIFLLPIHNQALTLLNAGLSDGDRFRKATSGDWTINATYRSKPAIAVGLMDMVSRGVYPADRWLPVEKTTSSGKARTVWRFEPRDPPPAVLGALMHRNFLTIFEKASLGFWQRGNPVAFEVDLAGHINVLVGMKKHEIDR